MNLSAIITYNTDRYFEKQVELFRKNVEGDIVLIDNSSDYNYARNLRNLARKLETEYIKTAVNEADFSRSHAYACTVAYEMSKGYDTLLFADHDMFPVSKFDLEKYSDKVICGIQQMRVSNSMFGNKVHLEYMQPALMLLNKNLLNGVEVDFYPCEVRGTHLDTGGGLYKLVMGNKDRCHFFSEEQKEHEKYTYSVVEKDWIHFIKGSNWNRDEDHDKRIETLFKLLP